jgi:putative hydrolase of the HAD superfamily
VGCEGLLPCFDGAREVLTELSREHTLGVVTNGEERLQSAKLTAIGLDSHVRHLVCSGSFGCEKPDPRIFHHALSLAGVTAEKAVFVGDSLTVDVAGARAAGIQAVWFNPRGATAPKDAPVPDAEIRGFAELPGVLAQLRTRAR